MNPSYNDGFRAGVCLGNSTECLGTNIKLGYAGEFGGFNIGLPFIPVGDGFAKDILLPASFVGFDLRPMPLQGGGPISPKPTLQVFAGIRCLFLRTNM